MSYIGKEPAPLVVGTTDLGGDIGSFMKSFLITSDAPSAKTVLNIPSNPWPVGSVYVSVTSTNPASTIGIGTWVLFGSGRTLVGHDASQSEFDTIEKIGGAKTHTLTNTEMPNHNHQSIVTYDGVGGNFPATGGAAMKNNTGDNPVIQLTTSAGGGGAHNNLQPYVVVYFWKRTA